MDFSSGGGPLAFSPALQRRVLVVVVDTEEEFDWTQPFDGRATAVTAMRHLHRIQDVCDEFGIRPCYAVDYSVATREEGRAPVRELLRSGRAELAAHLHPWINPPFVEPVCARNSYPGNLDPRLEEAKLRELLAALAEGFGERPAVYKAARYGLGPNTPALLERLGFVADVSRSPAFDLSADGGPDYSGEPDGLVWMGPRRQILGIPCTGSFVGFLGRRLGRIVYRQATRPALAWMRLPGILSRLGAVERLYLSSEGFSLRDNVRLTRGLLRRGERVFGFAVHSPSAVPGHTPFVRDDADLRRFLDGMRRFFDFFLNTLGGVAMTPLELRRHVADQAPAPAQPLEAGRSPGSRPVDRAFARGSEG
jgi:hypothetical protein